MRSVGRLRLIDSVKVKKVSRFIRICGDSRIGKVSRNAVVRSVGLLGLIALVGIERLVGIS